MTEIIKNGVYFFNGDIIAPEKVDSPETPVDAYEKTVAYRVFRSHSVRDTDLTKMHIRFDTLVSDGMEGAQVIKQADENGLQYFPVPCVLGGKDDALKAFGQSAAKRFGGFFAPLSDDMLHAYVCRQLVASGNMILECGDKTWCGALGCVAVKGTAEDFKQQINVKTYDIKDVKPAIIMLEGECTSAEAVAAELKRILADGVFAGMAVEICGKGLTIEQRMAIDSVIDANDCLCTVWHTDSETQKYFGSIKRPEAYDESGPAEGAYYVAAVKLDMSALTEAGEKIELPEIDGAFVKSKTYNGFPIPKPDVKLTKI